MIHIANLAQYGLYVTSIKLNDNRVYISITRIYSPPMSQLRFIMLSDNDITYKIINKD